MPKRLRLPATGPLLLTELLFGPAVLGLVEPEVLDVGLRVIVRAAVAVVVFEGGLLLDVGELRHTSRAVFGLVTFLEVTDAGQIIKIGDNTFLVRIFQGRDENGKRIYVARTIHGTKGRSKILE